MTYGKRLRKLRKERWWTLEEASKFLGIPASTLGGYENELRKPSLKMLSQIAKKYKVSTDYILGLSEDRNIKKVESNIDEYFKKDSLTYKGVRITRQDLQAIEHVLDIVISHRLKDNSEENPKNERQEHYA